MNWRWNIPDTFTNIQNNYHQQYILNALIRVLGNGSVNKVVSHKYNKFFSNFSIHTSQVWRHEQGILMLDKQRQEDFKACWSVSHAYLAIYRSIKTCLKHTAFTWGTTHRGGIWSSHRQESIMHMQVFPSQHKDATVLVFSLGLVSLSAVKLKGGRNLWSSSKENLKHRQQIWLLKKGFY